LRAAEHRRERRMSPDARLFPGMSWALARAELDRELAWRRRTWPDRVAGGRMPKAEADYGLAILAAIAADVDRMAHSGPGFPPAPHAYGWAERRAALLREIEARDRDYPELIAGGRLTADRAAHQLQALRAILWRYDCGFDWRPTNGTPAQSAQDMLDDRPETPQQRETWAEMNAIWRWPDGLFYRRWPAPNIPAAEPELAL
jgi:hypothetical protein